MIRTKDLKFGYKSSKRWEFPDILLAKGQSLLISGLSGSGKTTFMHLLAGILKPSSGEIQINNTSITKLSGAKLDAFRGKNIGVVFQVAHFIGSLSVEENLELAQVLPGIQIDKRRIQHLLESLQLISRSKAKPSELSVGEQQRLSIARALINKPTVLLADEPTSALDDLRCTEIINQLTQLSKVEESTLVVISHDSRLKSHFSNYLELNA